MAEAKKKEDLYEEGAAPGAAAPDGAGGGEAAGDRPADGPGLAEAAEGYAVEAAAEPPADPAALVAELAALRAERDELRDRMMRALADAENSRKRAERDRREGLMYGGAKLARDVLPVYDHLTRALEAAGEDTRTNASGFYEGIDLTLRELVNVLARHGVERIMPQPGDAFDPHQHQAMFEAPVADVPPGHIVQVMTVGFRMHDQLLRPAQVGVSTAPAAG